MDADEVRAALAAARSHDHARSVLQHRLPVRRDLPERGATRRARPSRPGGRAAREGDRGSAAEVAVLPRHRVRLLLAPARLHDRGELVPARRRAAERAELAASARRVDAERATIGARRGCLWQQILPVRRSRGCGGPRERSLLAAAGARSDRPAAGGSFAGPVCPRAAGSRGPISCAAASCRAFPSIRPARPTSSIPTPAASPSRQRPRLDPDARSSRVRCDEHRHSRARLPRRCSAWRSAAS